MESQQQSHFNRNPRNDNNNSNTNTNVPESSSTIIVSTVTLNHAADELVRQYNHAISYLSSTSTSNNNDDNDSTTTITLSFRNCCFTLLKLLNNIIKHSSVPSLSNNNSNNENDMYHKVRRIHLYNKTIQQHIVNFPPVSSSSHSGNSISSSSTPPPPGVAFLYACGFIKSTSQQQLLSSIQQPVVVSIGNAIEMEQTLLLLPQNENNIHIQKAIQLLISICIYELHIPLHDIPTTLPNTTMNTTVNETNPSSTATTSTFPGGFNPYQGYRIDITGQNSNHHQNKNTSSNSKIDLELQQLQNAKNRLLLQQQNNNGTTLDHEWVLTIVQPSSGNNNNPTTTTNTTSTSTNTNMSDGTILAQRIQQQSMERMKRETSGFTTKAMRDIETLKQSRIYTHVSLCIHMTFVQPQQQHDNKDSNNNTIIVQFNGKFSPNDTIDTVMTSLRNDCFVPLLLDTTTTTSSSSLSTNQKMIDFELYSTPPMMTYNDTKRYNTLQQEQLVPASKLFLRWIASSSSSSGNQKSKKRSTITTTTTPVPNPTTAILQPKWLSIIESNHRHSNDQSMNPTTTTASSSFPKSIPIHSVLPTNDSDTNDEKKKSSVVQVPPTKKLTKEELMLRRMMGGK